MGLEQKSRSPSTRRCTLAEKEQAVRLVRQLRRELGTDQGAVARVSKLLGYGVESVRSWVKRADIGEERVRGRRRRTRSGSRPSSRRIGAQALQ